MYVPVRITIALQMFFANSVLNTLRLNLVVAINAMVNEVRITNVTDAICPQEVYEDQKILSDNYGPRYQWDAEGQSLVSIAYYCGYLVTAIPGGMLAEQFGSRIVVAIVMFASGLLTLITPFVCAINFMTFVALRFFLGLLGGVFAPCLNIIVVHWAPLIERGKYLVIMFGNTLGAVFVWTVLPYVMEYWGWCWLFFIPGIMAIIMSGLWWKVIRDTPREHPWITKAERQYIEANLPNFKKVQRLPPFIHIFRNLRVWSLTALHLGDQWGMHLLLTVAPTFNSEVLGFTFISAGQMSSLPCISKVFFGLLLGSLADYANRHKLMTITALRKGFVVFSHIMPGIFLSAMNFTDCSRTAAITIMAWALAFSGAATVTNLPNSQDLAPNYAGTLYGVLNCVACTAALLIPVMSTFTIENPDSTLYEWYAVYSIGAGVYFISGIIFFLFGTANRQAFNEMVT